MSPQSLPCSEACERNKGPISQALGFVIGEDTTVLEVGSGTGQHICHFAETFPNCVWQPADVNPIASGVSARVARSPQENLLPPKALRVGDPVAESYGGIFSANTLHIMDEESAMRFFAWVAEFANRPGWLAVYGPFNDNGQFTSDGNRSLDAWARATFPGGGLRDLQAVLAWAQDSGWTNTGITWMPANNQFMTFSLE